MNTCRECATLLDGQNCSGCGAVYPAEETAHPAVNWDEVQEHLFRRLGIDDDATFLGEKEYFWWPGFLRQHVYVAGEGTFDDESGDNWLQIVGETPIARVSENQGVNLADEANVDFVHGAAIFYEDTVLLRTAFALNPLNRQMLKIFHEQLLAQVTLAHELAQRWAELEGVEIAYSNHPDKGPRDRFDEMLGIFWGDKYELPIVEGFDAILKEARTFIPEIMTANGWEIGFKNEDVDFFQRGETSVGIGIRPNDPENLKYGPGIFVYANNLAFQAPLEPIESNLLNTLVASLDRSSQFGAFVSQNYLGDAAARVTAFLPYGPLAEFRHRPLDIAIETTNFAVHVSNSCMRAFSMVAPDVHESEEDHSDAI